MSKFKRGFLLFFFCVLLCTIVTGCSAGGNDGNSGSKSIHVNLLNGSVKLTKVTFYDFYNEVKVSSYSGKGFASSNSLNSTEIHFTANDGTYRVICVNTKLSAKPSKVRVYINSKKSKYDTYSCSY